VTAEGLGEELLDQTPNRPAVFLLWQREGEPYLARTNVLKRRLNRLARMDRLRENVERVEIWYTGSALEAQARMYELAREHFPKRYAEILHLRMPPYVKLLLGNKFPRTAVSSQFSAGQAVVCGPFRSRASAERFEEGFLDLFQIRRCQEDLVPSPEHPGCMYGEMGKCLRPCQQVVGEAEYRTEARRVAEFLETGGRSLIEPAEAARARFSEELDFEQAARQHERIARIEEVTKLLDELARPLDRMNGIAVLPSAEPQSIELGLMRQGHWQGLFRVGFGLVDGKPVPLDGKLREAIAGSGVVTRVPKERQEYLAILARWFYSSWRDGEYLSVESFEDIPYRKLVNAVSRVHRDVV
jgi:excinuclease UvrABC nuclease subunit